MSDAAYFIARAAYHAGNGDVSQWGVCFAARRIVGCYDRGKTLELAQTIRRSVDTVERMAAAAVVYLWLRSLFPHSAELRFNLPYHHFWRLGQAVKRYEFSPVCAMGYLTHAIEQGWSPESMADFIESEQDQTKYATRYDRQLDHFHTAALKLLDKAPSYQRAELEAIIKRIEKLQAGLK